MTLYKSASLLALTVTATVFVGCGGERKRLDTAIQPFMDAECEYLTRMLEAVDDGKVMLAMYLKDMCSVLRSQEVVAAALEVSDGNLTTLVSDDSRASKAADALQRTRERMLARLPPRKDEPSKTIKVSPAFVVDAVKSRRHWSASDWDGLQANLKKDLSGSTFAALIAAQEKYHMRDHYVP